MRVVIRTEYDLPEVHLAPFTVERSYWDGTIWQRPIVGMDDVMLLSFQPRVGDELPLGMGVPTRVEKRSAAGRLHGARIGKAVLWENIDDAESFEPLIFENRVIRDRSRSWVIEVEA